MLKVVEMVGKPATQTEVPLRPRLKPDRGAISIDRVEVAFGKDKERIVAVSETTVDIKPGEFVCILGPSGCGKSTLLNCIAGYVTPSQGQVLVDGEPISGPGPDRGMVFQQYSLFPWKTVRENVAFGPRILGRWDPTPEAVADTFIEMVGLSRFAHRYPAELSGGMQQRVGIARALANYPRVLLMDEPFGALDSQTRHVMQENLLKIWGEFGITVVFVTHDIDEAIFLGDRVLIMSASPGQVIADLRIDLPRPRDPDIAIDDSFIRLKRLCHDRIRHESTRAFEQQNK